MKFFNWVHSKITAGQANKKPHAVPPASTSNQAKVEEAPKEKFNDWSNGLLTIGTFGDRDPREDQEIQQRVQINSEDSNEIQESSSPDHDLAEFTTEEVGQLQKVLTRLLKRKPTSSATTASKAPPPPEKGGSEDDRAAHHQDMPLDRFLNCPSSLEVDRTISNRYSINSDQYRDDEEDIDRTIRAIIGRCKQVSMENKKKSIGKKSISFLLKKMFVCTSGYVPSPSLRDTLQESRMEKLLRTMLSKKIYHRNGSRASSTKRFLVDTRAVQKAEKDDDDDDDDESLNKQGDGGCKWVKTDSEYIVLDLD